MKRSNEILWHGVLALGAGNVAAAAAYSAEDERVRWGATGAAAGLYGLAIYKIHKGLKEGKKESENYDKMEMNQKSYSKFDKGDVIDVEYREVK